jgi:ribonucleotide reductase class II
MSGEGAIQFAPEAIARSNADLLNTPELRQEFIQIYCDQGRDEAGRWLCTNPVRSVMQSSTTD